jgi:hypothetical protein
MHCVLAWATRIRERAAFWPPLCVERRNNATLALARYFLPPSPSAPLPRVRPFGAGLFLPQRWRLERSLLPRTPSRLSRFFA